MAPWRGPAPDLLPPGAAAGLKSTGPLCALRSSTHGRTPQKLPRLPLSFARTATLLGLYSTEEYSACKTDQSLDDTYDILKRSIVEGTEKYNLNRRKQ
ncbi:hypothetical protein NDU88_004587 [Pleurodeles waltl]|uniref:Uncharacterized protein n=1 Tax=Pleurodeles waltl TaxID=8319 RepID=A0AAV7M6Q0_PLEWA|nr:hypothetical protein NDU88_004587 [Pleurodeles waltl]